MYFTTQETYCNYKLQWIWSRMEVNPCTRPPHTYFWITLFSQQYCTQKAAVCVQTNAAARRHPRTCDVWGCAPDCQWCRVRLRRHGLLLPTGLNTTMPESCTGGEAFAVGWHAGNIQERATHNQAKLGPVYSIRTVWLDGMCPTFPKPSIRH